jgi:hypothetical protein
MQPEGEKRTKKERREEGRGRLSFFEKQVDRFSNPQ